MRLAVVTLAFAMVASPAYAQKRPKRTVAFAPLSTLGTAVASKEIRTLGIALHNQLSQVKGFTVVPEKKLKKAIAASGNLSVQGCQGQPECLSEMGALVNAEFVVAGEVGGLGEAQVIYLRLFDTRSKRMVRSTTLELAGTKADVTATRGAAIRLLDPDGYVGIVDVKVDVKGASIFVDGEKVARSPSKPLKLTVGSHALRVTHPEFRDFVRFVEVSFSEKLAINVELLRFPVVASDIRKEGGQIVKQGPVKVVPTPWYKSWYMAAGIGVVVLTSSALIFAVIANDIDSDASRKIDVPGL
jgi:hypothetical protein